MVSEDMIAQGTMDMKKLIKRYMPCLSTYQEQYKDFHQHPELSKQEHRTASIIEKHLNSLGYEVHANIGGCGVVGVLSRGSGRTVMLRADMDALPGKEWTSLPYASQAEQEDDEGNILPVMHACGHDMHITCLMAVAELLKAARSEWSGTIILLFQPAEEHGTGAKAMVDGGLYNIIPVPDVILGQHVDVGPRRAGSVAIRPGKFMSTLDTLAVKVYGKGGHTSQPHQCIDPIVLASYIIIRLQTIVSRMVDPLSMTIVSCGSFHAGNGGSAIPDTAEFQLDIYTYDAKIRNEVVQTVEDIIRAECTLMRSPHEPSIKRVKDFPLSDNDVQTVQVVTEAFVEFFGADRVHEAAQVTGSEDFSNLAEPNNTPSAYWFWGGTCSKEYDEAEKEGELGQIPSNHSENYAPVMQPTMTTGIEAMSVATLSLLALG